MGEGRDGGEREYADVPGFCKSAALDDIRKHSHVLTPGRYVGTGAAEEDDEPFAEKMQRLVATLHQQQAEAAELDAAIARVWQVGTLSRKIRLPLFNAASPSDAFIGPIT